METTEKKNRLGLIAAVPFAIIALRQLCHIAPFLFRGAMLARGAIFSRSFLWSSICNPLLFAADVWLAGRWFAYPYGSPRKSVISQPQGSAMTTDSPDVGYRNMLTHILLLLFTFGIYYFYWIYKSTDYLNCVEEEEPRNPVTKLLLCIFVPFYSIYWTYKSAQRIDHLASMKGVSSELTTLCLILAILVGIIPLC